MISNANSSRTYATPEILPDEPGWIQQKLEWIGKIADIDVVIFNGGTGIDPRHTTYDAIEKLLEKVLPGFG